MTFLIVASALLALLIILLCIPLEIEIRGDFQGQPVLRGRIIYLFRLVQWEIGGGGSAASVDGLASVKQGTGWIGLPEMLELAQIRGLPERAFTLVSRLMKSIRVRHVATDLRIGLGDDYYTGMLSCALIPIQLYVRPLPQYDVVLEPAFEEDLLLSGKIYAGWQMRPINVLGDCLAFACSLPALKAAGRIMIYRCRKKR